MENEKYFVYQYSAKENAEIKRLREKYLPREESKLEELKRLDYTVESSGMVESLSAGIGGALIFGFGMCLAMQVIGEGLILKILGILIGIAGIIGMLVAYPVYRKMFEKTKEKHLPRILELAAELTGEKSE